MNCQWNVSSCQSPVASRPFSEAEAVAAFQPEAGSPPAERKSLLKEAARRFFLGCRLLIASCQLFQLGTRNFRLSTLLLLFLAACQPGAPSASAPTESVLEVKQLATVYISPTPGEVELQATRRAFTATPSPLAAAPTPTATAYVGVFLGEVQADEGPALGLELLHVPPTPDRVATQLPTCQTLPDTVFGSGWSADTAVTGALGCPVQDTAQFRGVTQVFERGVMYWRGDTGEIWAIASSGPAAGRFWHVPQAAEAMNEDIQPPGGLRVPVRGFGGVWRNTPDVRDALGFARTDEQELAMQSQRFDRGQLFLDGSAGLVFALIMDGSAYGPFPI